MPRQKIVLFGDSLTQRGYEIEHKGWVARLSNAYTRKADVINRGYSGYNTRWALERIGNVTSQLSEPGGDGKPVVAIFFGANDASLKLGSASKQHVPIDEYKSNLCRMIEMIQPHAHALLISPPPVNEEAWAQHCNESDSNRSLEESKKYAKVVQEVSSERNLPFVDVWSRIYQSVSPDSKSESKLSDFFCDGLHLSSKGNQAVFEAFMEVVRDSKHIRSPDELPLDAELWDSLV